MKSDFLIVENIEGTNRLGPSLLTVVALGCLLAGTSLGCTLDFDEFASDAGSDDTSLVDSGDVAADTAPGDTGSMEDSTAPSEDVTDTSTGPTELVVGRECESDDDCFEDGICVDNYCTRGCQADDACPGDTICESWGGQNRCLVPCSNPCPAIEDRNDLNCTFADRKPVIGDRAGGARACLPDTDGDRVADQADNCSETTNPTQTDRDADGAGDACDDGATRCHQLAEGGVVDFGAVSFPADGPSIPPTVEGSFVPVVGGSQEGEPYGKIARLDLESGDWAGPIDLPYPVDGQGIAPLREIDRYVATPGASTAANTQRGRFVLFSSDGIQLDGPYELDVTDPLMATTGFGDFLVADTDNGGARFRIWRYRPNGGGFQRIHKRTIPGSKDGAWHATDGIRGNVFFYSTPTSGGLEPRRGRLIELSIQGGVADDRELEYPTIMMPEGDSRPMDPFLIQGPGQKRLYAFDRETGQAAVVEPDEGEVTREPTIDLSLPFTVESVAVIPQSPGFVLIGRDESAPEDLRARAYYPACHPDFLGLNADGDMVQDVTDNCPGISNSPQNDADRDDIGDSCDADSDNDGIPDIEDVRETPNGQQPAALDTDNDGEPNESDDDDDGDGLSDAIDRFPLDTDNDGLPNDLDGDDDDDGYPDNTERDNGADALDPLDFPNAGTVTYVRREPGDDPDRTVEVGPLTDLDEATEVIPASNDPHRPRFFDDSAGIAALTGDPGATTSLVWWTEMMGVAITHEVGQTLYDIVPGGADDNGTLTSATLVRRPVDGSERSTIGDYTLDSEMFQTRIDAFETIHSVDRTAGKYAVVAGPGDCESCLSLFSFSSASAEPQVRATPDGRIGRVHYDGSRFGFSTTTSDGEHRGFLVPGTLSPPPDVTQVASVVPLEMHGHVLISAKTKNDSFDIWLYNGRKQRWHRMHQTSDDLIEIDWIR